MFVSRDTVGKSVERENSSQSKLSAIINDNLAVRRLRKYRRFMRIIIKISETLSNEQRAVARKWKFFVSFQIERITRFRP
jgi:hypothetical protein